MITFFNEFILGFDTSDHVVIGARPIHLFLELQVQTFGVLAIFPPKDFCFASLQFKLFFQRVDLFFEYHVFFKKLLVLFVVSVGCITNIAFFTKIVS